MRVAYICADPGVPAFGGKGSSIHVQEIARAFLRGGAQVDLFTTRPGGDPPADLADVRVHTLALDPSADASGRERALQALNGPLRGRLETSGPFDLVYERYSLFGVAGQEYARAAGIPSVLEVNAPLIEEQARHRTLVDRPGAEEAMQRAMTAAATIVAVSNEVAEYLRSRGVAAEKIHVVENGVDCRRFTPAVAPIRPELASQFTVGFLGTLKPWHGVEILIRAFALLRVSVPSARLLIVGDGPQAEPLRAQVASLDSATSDAIDFTGPVEARDVPGLLTSMSVATAPYASADDFYFSPLKVYESMAAGRAIVASGVGQLRTLLRDGETGLLCPPGDERALAAALVRLYHGKELAERLGAAARRYVEANHDWSHVLQRILRAAGVADDRATRPARV